MSNQYYNRLDQIIYDMKADDRISAEDRYKLSEGMRDLLIMYNDQCKAALAEENKRKMEGSTNE